MREVYTEKLGIMNTRLEEMGQLLISQIKEAVISFHTRNSEMAKNIIDKDKLCNEKEKDIEHLCMSLLLLQQPVAADLRNVSSTLKMITDLERIGDQAADICELVLDMSKEPIERLEKLISEMYEQVIDLVINTMNSFQEKKSEKLLKLMESDDNIDKYLIKINDEAIDVIKTKVDLGRDALDYVMAAKHLEKIGDYAVHVIRWIYFYLEGIVPEKPESLK